jgi:hypothetical protein
MFVDLPDEGEAPVPSAGGAVRIAIGFCALVTVLLGAAAQPLFNLASGGAGSIH